MFSNNAYFSDSSHKETYTEANRLFQHFQEDRRQQPKLDRNSRVKSASTLRSNNSKSHFETSSRYITFESSILDDIMMLGIIYIYIYIYIYVYIN